MRRLIALGALLLAIVVTGCDEQVSTVGTGQEHQLFVQDTDGDVDQHNIDTACPYGAKPVEVERVHGYSEYAIVTCPGGGD